MNWLKLFMNKQCESTTNVTKTEEPCKPEWCVQRYKDKRWQQFGKGHRDIDDAVSAMIDWQHMFVGEEFRVAKVVTGGST